MMTADERMASTVPGGGMPQETEKTKLLSSLEDPLSDAVNGAFLSALLHHALDNLSATASNCTGDDKTEALNHDAEATNAPPLSAFSTANPRDMRNSGRRASRACSTSLTTSPNYSSTLLLERSNDGTRQRLACEAPAEGPPDSNHLDDDAKDIDIICLSEKGIDKSETVAECAWFRSGSQSASETGVTNVETNECVKSGSTAAATHGSAVPVLTPVSAPSKSNFSVDNICSEGAALMETHRDVEDIPAPGKNGRVSVTLKLCPQFPSLRIAGATRATTLSASNAAVTASLPRGSIVLSHKSTPTTTTSTVVENASSVDATEAVPRHIPFHILLGRLSGDAEAPLSNRAQRSSLQRHEEEVWQKQLTMHQRDSDRTACKRAHNFLATPPHTLVPDYAPLLQGKCWSSAADDRRAATLQELLAERPQEAGSRSICDLPGALLQQQSVGRALLTRLASLQVQQALLRYTVDLPRSPPQTAAPYHMRTVEDQTLSLHGEVGDGANKGEEGSSLSQQFSHDEWPVLASKENCSAITHTHLQQSELFSLMQNHTTCVFHFVIRALCLLANCCPTWAAAGDEVTEESAATKDPGSAPSPATAFGSREILRAATVTSSASREDFPSVATPAHDSGEPSASRYTTGNNVMLAGKHAEAVTIPHCKKWTRPNSSQRRFSTAEEAAAPKSGSLVEVGQGGLGGYAGISSYRWHWMHVVSFLTHPELLSVYHTTLTPLLSLFIPNGQSGSHKQCARIESLDTSSSHDDDLSTAGENGTEKAPQSSCQRQSASAVNNSCCGAGSWLVVRQVLCDLDDLRFLHDPSFVPCPQRQDPSFCAHLQQQHARMISHSHYAGGNVLSQSAPLLCCSAPKCSDECPGAFYCGTALLRSSVFFGSFLEASRALAVWPQYLAAAAAAALPLPADSGRYSRSALLSTDGEDGASVSPSLKRRRHMHASCTKGPAMPTTTAPRATLQRERRTDVGSRVIGECSSKTGTEFTDAARGVAACILKHVDLNKLDSTELLALLKLTEEAGSPSPPLPCQEHNRGESETGRADSSEALAATSSPVPSCNRSKTKVAPCTQSHVSGTPSSAESVTALKRSRDELMGDLQSHDQSEPPPSMCSASKESCPFTRGECGETEPVVSGCDMSCGHEVGGELLAVAVSPGADLATSAKQASRRHDSSPSLLVADGKFALPEEARKALLRFSPLFSPRKQQRSLPRLSEFHQNNTSTKKMEVTATPVPESGGERQPVESTLGSLNSTFCDLFCPTVSPENTVGLACAAGVGLSDFPQCNEKSTNMQDTLQVPDTGTRKTSLNLTEPAAIGETELLQLPDARARCHGSRVSPLRNAFPGASISAAVLSTGNSSYKDIAYQSGCRRVELQRRTTSAAVGPISETLENKKVSTTSTEHAVSKTIETELLSLAVAVAPTERDDSGCNFTGTNRSTGDEGDFKAKKERSESAVSALDIIEHERALSLVAAGVRNTRKRFRLQSVRRKAEARLHYGLNCLTLRTDGSSWDNKTMARISLHSVSPKQQSVLESTQSPSSLTPPVTEASQNSALCRLAESRVSSGVPGARRRHASGTTSAASGNNSSFSNSSHVRSPVKGIYYDSYKKLWRVQWNSCSGALQQPTTNISLSSVAHGGAGRRVSRSFSCARLGFEAAKARAVAWMLSGGHVGDGGLTDVMHRASPENEANSAMAGTAASGLTGATRPLGKHEVEKGNCGPPPTMHKVVQRHELDEREQKEKLLFANPKLFLERVEAFYVRNGLYGLQCGNGPAGSPAERQRAESKVGEEQQQGAGACANAVSQAPSSRKGNGGTGGLRIVSVLSLDDMLDIVQGKKITMSLPYAALKHTPVESQDRAGKSEVGLPESYQRSCYEGQHQVSWQRALVQETANQGSQPCFRDTQSNAESAKKKSRTRDAVVPLESGGSRCLPKPSFEAKIEGEDPTPALTDDVTQAFVRVAQGSCTC